VTFAVRGAGAALGVGRRRSLEKVGMILGAILGMGLGVAFSLEVVKPRWRPYSSAEGGFSVMLPCEPHDVSRDENRPDGTPLRVHALNCRPVFTTWGYAVSWVDRPDEEAAKTPALVLETIEKETIQKLGATLVRDQPIDVVGGVGRSFDLDVGRRHARERFYLVKSRLYFLCVEGPKDEWSAERVQQFFDSWKIDR
jgi:hypothetical protein